ncbi:MAG: hypothetical protein CMJ23_00740 [Phycisphaerae bacterium]|nr:hypothetical protein [Phycisphaerae bacterium]
MGSDETPLVTGSPPCSDFERNGSHMRTLTRNRLLFACLFLAMAPAIVETGPDASASQRREDDQESRRWKDRLAPADRDAAEAGVGFAMPELPADLTWLKGRAPFKSMEELQGRVLVIQSWTAGTSQGRTIPRKVEKALRETGKSGDVMVILLHTPEGIEKARAFCERVKTPFPVAFDASGAACDLIGAYRRPINVVIDREGEVRYAGLTDKGLRTAVAKVVAEPFNDQDLPPARISPPEPSEETSEIATTYPPIKGGVGSATDLRGKKAPTFFVDRWLSPEPDARGKVAIVDFWATWCGPCVKAIPHMNDLADTFRGKVECVGISDESPDRFLKGLRQRELDPSTFRYSLALDPEGQMKSAFNIRGIPHVAVMSTDWIVRWQGHPANLTAAIVQQIIDADPGVNSKPEDSGEGDASGGHPPSRWTVASKR